MTVGTAVSLWLCHRLMERDHRLGSVPLRETDLPDDRLANVLTMLSALANQAALDQATLAG
jgi:hypothetical protein